MKADPVARTLLVLSLLNVVVGVGNLILSHLTAVQDQTAQLFGGFMVCLGLAGIAFVALEDRRTK